MGSFSNKRKRGARSLPLPRPARSKPTSLDRKAIRPTWRDLAVTLFFARALRLIHSYPVTEWLMRRFSVVAAFLVTAFSRSHTPAPAAVSISHTAQVSNTSALLIAVSAVTDSVAWVSGSGGTWLRTSDGGITWQVG